MPQEPCHEPTVGDAKNLPRNWTQRHGVLVTFDWSMHKNLWVSWKRIQVLKSMLKMENYGAIITTQKLFVIWGMNWAGQYLQCIVRVINKRKRNHFLVSKRISLEEQKTSWSKHVYFHAVRGMNLSNINLHKDSKLVASSHRLNWLWTGQKMQ